VSRDNPFDSRSFGSYVGMVLLFDRSPDAAKQNEFELKVALCLVSHHSVTSSTHALVLVAKSMYKKPSLCKDIKKSGVAACGN